MELASVLKPSTKTNFKSPTKIKHDQKPINPKTPNPKTPNPKSPNLKSPNNISGESEEKENQVGGLSECSPNHLLKIIENLKQENKLKDGKISKFMEQIQEQNDYITEHIVETDELQEQLMHVREKLDASERTKSSVETKNIRLENQLSAFQLKVLEVENKLKEVEFDSKRTIAITGSKTRRPSYTESVPMEIRISEAEKLSKRYPNCIPIILEPPQKGSTMANQLQFDGTNFQRKLLMPAEITFREFCARVRKHMLDSNTIQADPKRDAIYFYINRNFSTCLMDETLQTIHQIHRHSDGFLYVNFAKEATFGMNL